jgi:hypothetical protein
MKWDHEKEIHQKLIGEVQWIQAEMDVPIEVYLDTSKNMQNLWIDVKKTSWRDWETLPHDEENRENESYIDTMVDTTKVNEK